MSFRRLRLWEICFSRVLAKASFASNGVTPSPLARSQLFPFICLMLSEWSFWPILFKHPPAFLSACLCSCAFVHKDALLSLCPNHTHPLRPTHMAPCQSPMSPPLRNDLSLFSDTLKLLFKKTSAWYLEFYHHYQHHLIVYTAHLLCSMKIVRALQAHLHFYLVQ